MGRNWRWVGAGSGFAMIAVVLGILLVPTASGQTCPNALLRIGPGANLPDCRAYERASPKEKNGGAVEGFPNLLTTSTNGSSVTFFTQAGTGIPAGPGATQDFGTYLAKKEGETWSTLRLLAPQSLGETAAYLGATPDQRFAFVEASKPGTEADSGRGLYMLDTSDQEIQTIVPNSANQRGAPEFKNQSGKYAIDGASTDGSRVLFETSVPLLPNVGFGDNLYLWSRATNEVTLAGVLPGEPGEAPEAGSFGGAYEWFEFQEPEQGGALAGLAVQAVNALTPDAGQVFFTASGTGQLYLRRGLAGAKPETVHISTPNPGVVDPNGEKPAAFQEATPDGARAFFLSSGKLTPDANTGEGDNGRDLYRWDAASGKLTDITPDGTDELGARVQGLLGISEDGTTGYLVARGILAAGAEPGSENLYRFDASTAPPTIEFIAILEAGLANDQPNWSPWGGLPPGIVSPKSMVRTSRVSPDGRTLLFSSVRSLTGYDSNNALGIECTAGCPELFRYALPIGSSSGGSLSCISCDSSGARPVGAAHLQSNLVNGGGAFPNGDPMVNVPDNLSESGNQIFFESPDSLVPADTNGASGCPALGLQEKASCQDVYEWEAAGTPDGSCLVPELAGGCLYLLSTGKSTDPSFFAGASADGQVAYIVTSSQLVPDDTDTATDAYAVRVDGGLAAQFMQPPGICSGETCLAPPYGPPNAGAIGSATLEGPQNAMPKHKKAKHKKHKKHKKAKHKKQKQKQKKASRGQGNRAHEHSARLGGKG
jgi:hypothetical protein